MLCLVRYLVILKTCVFSRTLLPEVAIFVKAGEVEMPGRLRPLIGAVQATQLLRQPTQLLQKGRNGFYAVFNSLGHIATRQKHGTGKEFAPLQEWFQGVFKLQKDHRQPSTTPHNYIAIKPTHLLGSSGDS